MLKRKFGFSLAEILITMTIIGILAVILIPKTFNNANTTAAKNKFRTNFVQIQKGLNVANEVYHHSFLDISAMDKVDDFMKKYLNAKSVTRNAANDELENISRTYLLPTGAQLIIPNATAAIIAGNGCVETATLSAKCIAYIDVNGNKGPNSVLGTVVTSGSDTPDDETGACISGTYAINTQISENECILPDNVLFDIYPVVLENNGIKPYSNAVSSVLSNSNRLGETGSGSDGHEDDDDEK